MGLGAGRLTTSNLDRASGDPRNHPNGRATSHSSDTVNGLASKPRTSLGGHLLGIRNEEGCFDGASLEHLSLGVWGAFEARPAATITKFRKRSGA